MNTWSDITKLSGVNAMYMYQLGDKKYYFFGDKHYSRRENDCEKDIKCDDFDYSYNHINYYGTSCMSIGSLLYVLFMYNNAHNIQTDFYLEASFTKGSQRTDVQIAYDIMKKRKLLRRNIDYDESTIDHQFDVVSWMSLLEYVLEPCFIREKTNCPFYPNIHYHYADVRSIDDKESSETDPFILFDIKRYYKHLSDEEVQIFKKDFQNLLYILIFQYKLIFKMILTKKNFNHYLTGLIENMSQFFKEPMKTLYINKFENVYKMSVIREGVRMHRIAAELLTLKKINPQLSTKIKKFILLEADKNIIEVQELYNNTTFFIDEDDDDYLYEIETFMDYLLPISALSMDFYLLARMFIQNGKEIIVYAGSNHITRYAKFFDTMTDALITSPSIPDNRCLNIENLPYYLDANKYRQYAKNM